MDFFQPLTSQWQLFEDKLYWECPEEDEGLEEHHVSEAKENKLRLSELKQQLAKLTAAVVEYERGDVKETV